LEIENNLNTVTVCNEEKNILVILTRDGAYIGKTRIAIGDFMDKDPSEMLTEHDFPKFFKTLYENFPGALELKDFVKKTAKAMKERYGFNTDNTMGMVSICRDEITDPLHEEVIKHWGKTFNCSGLAGFVFMGKTGLAASTGHTPMVYDFRRFIFYAMPHIAIGENGNVGSVHRKGMRTESHACGALGLIVKELECGHINLITDMQDVEQSFIRQKILSNLHYGTQVNLVDITKLACKIINDDVEHLLGRLDINVFRYSIVSGVQIHGPKDSTYIWPFKFTIFNPNKEDVVM